MLSSLIRKFKFALFIPRKITRVPKEPENTISDLFPIRHDESWKTQFELLNVPYLLNGQSTGEGKELFFYFFDIDGKLIGMEGIKLGQNARNSIKIPTDFVGYESAKTFAIFHSPISDQNFAGSFLAERGYTGYEFKNSKIKGYVHGNLDSIALNGKETLQLLGNKSFFKRKYLVQHVLTGPANYDFSITNPTDKYVKVKVKIKLNNRWKKISTYKIPSRGIRFINVHVSSGENKLIKLVSKFYLGRPVVFRTTATSMDVFHG